ncbi:hypothetical protein CDO52_25870 [Nocardiopsis gilva YIM 90087]|uniref:DUF642 domain-containing protein n=1 Tax=Nocardiopsis gilva YIM 90087 TaxID=1235441 RepID=A0A223SCG0_9ACTN|nr:hypothetical protein [Nocardiopsis gilva]ASU85775.1 hypothetical protein CDO52_25870 [Nocardiopsis gilva YIM 90087]
MPVSGNVIDLSRSPQARTDAHYLPSYTVLGTPIDIDNPRFTNPHVTGDWDTFSPNPSIYGWAVTVGNIDVVSAAYAQTGNSSQAVNLNGTEVGEIQQDLLTLPGYWVTIKLRAGHNAYGSCENKLARFWIQVNDDVSTRVTYNLGKLADLVDEPDKQNYWHEVTYEFRARGFDYLQLHGDPDPDSGGVCGALVTEVRGFQRALTAPAPA